MSILFATKYERCPGTADSGAETLRTQFCRCISPCHQIKNKQLVKNRDYPSRFAWSALSAALRVERRGRPPGSNPFPEYQNRPGPLRWAWSVLMAEGVGFEPTVGCPTLDFESSALNRTQPSLHFIPGDFVLRINVLRTLCGFASHSTTTFMASHAVTPPKISR